jgi:hypothetical protein
MLRDVWQDLLLDDQVKARAASMLRLGAPFESMQREPDPQTGGTCQ